jgi:hypothetical protein
MTATYTQVKEALGVVLAAIPAQTLSDGSTKTLTVYPELPGQIVPPAAVIAPGDGTLLTYRTSNFSHDLSLTVTVFVQRGQNRSTDEQLSGFISIAGDQSVYAAVDANSTLGGVVDDARVTQARNWGVWTFGEITYLGVIFDVEVLL